jgi:polysaccharide export outer membrane protein
VFAQGEYIGPARLPHLAEYRLRVDDKLEVVYRLSGELSGRPYQLNVRDRLHVESLTVPETVNREVSVQPDGTVTLPRLGQVMAAGRTVEELRNDLERRYARDLRDPQIVVTPLEFDTTLEELRQAVNSQYSFSGGQTRQVRVTPEGTIQLPAIGSVGVQGLTLPEVEREIEARYSKLVNGIEVTPVLLERAPRYIYVVGEVKQPGRFTLEGPTTVLQAIALAGSWNVGAALGHVVVFRRDENWRLMATKLNLGGALIGTSPCPPGEIWLRDSDIVIVPKSPILIADDFIDLVFTRGIYGVFPAFVDWDFTRLNRW